MDRAELRQLVRSRRERCVDFLQQAIRIPSITKNEAEISALIARTLSATKADVSVVEAEPGHPNVVASARSGRPGPILLLNDHMDVVPPGPRDEWSVDPFGGIILDGWLYGRGAVDSKSGLCAIIMATEIFLEAGGPARGELLLTAVCDEEVGSVLGTRYLLKQGFIRGDFGIVAEPTGSRLEVAAKGVLLVEIETKGKMAHGGKPWAGVNAIEHMGRIISALQPLVEDLSTRRHPVVGAPSLQIGTISGGTVPNMVASDCRMVVDRRILPGESSAEALAEIQAVIDALGAQDPRFSCRATTMLDWPSVEISQDVPVISALSRAIKEVSGCAPEIGGKDGGTDAGWIYQATGIRMVHFSPGESHLVLAADERVSLASYMDAIEILTLCFEEILGLDETTSRLPPRYLA